MGSPLYENEGYPQAMHGSRTPVRVEQSSIVAVRIGMAHWNLAAQRELFVFDASPQVTLAYEEGVWQAQREGNYPDHTYVITMSPNPVDSDYSIIAQELGHCLGLKHRNTGIMGGQQYQLKRDRKLLKKVGYIGSQ